MGFRRKRLKSEKFAVVSLLWGIFSAGELGGEAMKTIRIGSGAGFSGDRIEPAVELAERGKIQYLGFECLAERTIALAQMEKRRDPSAGFDPLLRARMEAVLRPCAANRTRIVTNMGAANPGAAALATAEAARSLGLRGLRIAAVAGDTSGRWPLTAEDGSMSAPAIVGRFFASTAMALGTCSSRAMKRRFVLSRSPGQATCWLAPTAVD